MESDNMKEWALKYSELGWAPIPLIPKDKAPLIYWKPYQGTKPSPKEISKWWTKWPHANIGIIAGEVSQIIVFDVDGQESLDFTINQGGFPKVFGPGLSTDRLISRNLSRIRSNQQKTKRRECHKKESCQESSEVHDLRSTS